MTRHQKLRWLLLVVLYPINLVFILLQMLVTPLFLKFVKNKWGEEQVEADPQTTLDQLINLAKKTEYSPDGFIRKETHTLLVQSGNGLFNPQNQERLLEQVIKPNGSLFRERKPNGEEGEPYLGPSGDGLSSWVFNYLLWQVHRPDLVDKVATHYLKNCFGLEWNEKGGVSNRSSNSGLNLTIEEWNIKGKNLGFSVANPVTGPGFLTSQALLELAARELGGKWKWIAKLHYLLLGGWYFSRVPAMYTKKTASTIFYTQHISALNLWSLCELGRDYKQGLKFIEYNGPRARPQPWITCLSWDQDVVDKNRRDLAISYLESYTGAVEWPQIPILSSRTFKTGSKETRANYTMMGFAAMLLKMQ